MESQEVNKSFQFLPLVSNFKLLFLSKHIIVLINFGHNSKYHTFDFIKYIYTNRDIFIFSLGVRFNTHCPYWFWSEVNIINMIL